MDFTRVELSDEDQAFQAQARRFLAAQVTDEVRRRDRVGTSGMEWRGGWLCRLARWRR